MTFDHIYRRRFQSCWTESNDRFRSSCSWWYRWLQARRKVRLDFPTKSHFGHKTKCSDTDLGLLHYSYSPGVVPQKAAAKEGYAQNLWLDGPERYLTEVSNTIKQHLKKGADGDPSALD